MRKTVYNTNNYIVEFVVSGVKTVIPPLTESSVSFEHLPFLPSGVIVKDSNKPEFLLEVDPLNESNLLTETKKRRKK